MGVWKSKRWREAEVKTHVSAALKADCGGAPLDFPASHTPDFFVVRLLVAGAPTYAQQQQQQQQHQRRGNKSKKKKKRGGWEVRREFVVSAGSGGGGGVLTVACVSPVLFYASPAHAAALVVGFGATAFSCLLLVRHRCLNIVACMCPLFFPPFLLFVSHLHVRVDAVQ
ncbi:hypothetical protein TRSC58_07541 [Trypanosoma rangeli SC58]|uniref:Uncharacterized protein n=1 Tax=Trypanosoma rangeli SC58 TaxID=429131 RepID=A0A061ISY2_TRYRA|nr:hypothetical protein TRSC58_07541 [Trypanosoma rangeli SC58]